MNLPETENLYHKDKECNSAIIRLLDALCEWERNTGRRSTLIFIPHNLDEEILVAMDGKSLSKDSSVSINQAINWAFKERMQTR